MIKSLLALVAIVVLVGCNASGNKTNIEIIQNMMDQISIKAQDWDPKHPDEVQMWVPPANTISRERPPYEFANNMEGGWKQVNPYAGDMSAEFLTLGSKKYATYCLVCHGATGAGDGPVTEHKDMKGRPRNLVNADAKAYSDGRMFYAITQGYGIMGGYASQIPNAKERWAIVNYVRSLQKQAQ